LYNPKLERRLRRVQAPTLVLWGADDTFLPLAHGEAYARLIADARLQVIPDCGHLVPLEQMERFAAQATAFLAES
jgi:pimeloyl-ACP methyl ester carboxylesterase